MRILLTDGGNKNTLAIIRCLGKLGHSVSIIHHKKSVPYFSKYCNEVLICPPIVKKTEHLDCLLSIIQNHKFDLLIPVGAKSIEIISKNIQLIKVHISVEFSSYEKVQVALEKRKTYELAKKLNIPFPKTFYPKSLDEALQLSDSIKYPVICKSQNESKIKFKTLYINSKKDFKDVFLKLNKIINFSTDPLPLIQERVFGKGYGFFALYQNGKCKKVFMHQRIREFPVSGGVSTCAKSYYDKKLMEYGKKILDHLEWHGQAMVEFKKDEVDGKYKLMEINPKFWGSLELSLVAGVNFPKYICDMANGENLTYNENYNRNIQFQWLFANEGEIFRLLSKPSDFFKVVSDIFRFHSKNDFKFYDLKPSLLEIKNFFISCFIKLLR